MMAKATNPRLVEWCLSRLARHAMETDHASYEPLSKLAVVVPSYCRQNFLLRQLVYWHGSAVELYLLDGSPEPIDASVIDALNQFPKRHYIHNPTASFVDRVAALAPTLSHAFVVMLGDDEYHLPHGLSCSVRFLEENPDYVGSIGQSLRFFLSQDHSLIGYGRGYDHFGYRAENADLGVRLARAMAEYNAATCYAVLTNQAWQNSWGGILETSCKDVSELHQALATYMLGRFAAVDEIYWMRSDENVSVSDHQVFRDINFSQWWRRPVYEVERRGFMDRLLDIAGISGEASRQRVEAAIVPAVEAFHGFYIAHNRPATLWSAANAKKQIVRLLRGVLPPKLYQRLRPASPHTSDPMQQADIGSLSQLSGDVNQSLFSFDEATRRDIARVEELTIEFYRVQRFPLEGPAEPHTARPL